MAEEEKAEKRLVFKTNYSLMIASRMLYKLFKNKIVYAYLKGDKIIYSLNRPNLPIVRGNLPPSLKLNVCFEKRLRMNVNKKSLLVVIPKPFAEKLGIKIGDKVNVVLIQDGFMIFK